MADLTGPNPDEINGDVAHDAVDSGNPVKIGGFASNTLPTAVNVGDRVNALMSLRGALAITTGVSAAAGDAIANANSAYIRTMDDVSAVLLTEPLGYNGSTWDRPRTTQGVATGANADLGIMAAGVGPGFARIPAQQTTVGTGAQAIAGVNALGAAMGACRVSGTYTGLSGAVQGTFDGTNWINLPMGGIDIPISGWAANGQSFSATQGVVQFYTMGARQVRFNVVALVTGTATFDWTLNAAVSGTQPAVLYSSGNNGAINSQTISTDTVAAPLALSVLPFNVVFNGTTWERQRASAGFVGGTAVGGPTAADAATAVAPVTIGARASTALPTAMSTDGDVVNLWASLNGALNVTLRDASGTYVAVGGGTQFAEDSALGANPTGTVSMARRTDTLATLTPIVDDAVSLRTTSQGALWVALDNEVAHDAVDAGSPIKIGGYAKASNPSSVSADGDRVNAWFGRQGAIMVGTGSTPTAAADATANQSILNIPEAGGGQYAVIVGTYASLFNGTTWDRQRATPGVTGALAIGGLTAADAAVAAAPVTVGARGSTATPTAMSTDGDVTNLWTSLNGALNVILRDTSGTAIATGVQYVEDTALAANLGQGTLVVARRTDTLATLTPAVDDAVGVRVNSRGALWTIPDSALMSTPADANTVAAGQLVTMQPMIFNGASYDQQRAVSSSDGRSNTGIPAMAGLVFNGTNLDRMRAIASLDAAPNVDTGVLAVGVGPGWDRKRDPAGVAATSTSNAITVVVDGAATVRFHVTAIGTTPGSMIIETTTDDTNWATAAIVIKGGTEQYVNGAFVPAVNDVYVVNTIGVRQVRYRVNAVYASGTATVKWTASAAPQFTRIVPITPSTPTSANVAASASNVTLLAANGARLGATVYNDSTVICYLKLGATASATSFTKKLFPDEYYEVPFGYAGIIDGIWVSATGNARVTEIV